MALSLGFVDTVPVKQQAQAPSVAAARPSAPLTLGKLVLGVFLGNLLTAVVCGLAYFLITAR